MNETQKLILVGDNPFHGISHLSQERARNRGENIIFPAEKAADIVMTSIRSGANGIALISQEGVDFAKEQKLNPVFEDVCCSLAYQTLL